MNTGRQAALVLTCLFSAGVLLLAAIAGGFYYLLILVWTPKTDLYPVYENLRFGNYDPNMDDYSRIYTGHKMTGDNGAVGVLYIRFTDGHVCRLQNLTPEVIERYFHEIGSIYPEETLYGNSGWTTFTFINGKLVDASLCGGVEIATSAKGPFWRLPISKRRILREFGEPRAWEEISRGRH